MTNRMIENRVKKIQELEQKKAEIETEIEKLKDELRADLEEKGVDEIKTERGTVVRWKEVVSNRFDSKLFKTDFPKMYDQYTKPNVSHRFTWAVA